MARLPRGPRLAHARELDDTAAIRALARAIAHGEAESARTTAADLLEPVTR